ncbi:MAG: sortase [Anaerolineales bacterium]
MHSNTFLSRSFFSFRFVIALLLVIPQVVVLNTKVKAAPEPEPVVTAPLRNGAASVAISGLGSVPVGQNVSFSVSFDNTGTSAGYGPFIDVILDTTGIDGVYPGTPAPANTYDGLGTTTISAKYLGAAIPAQDFFTVQFDAAGNATHPFALNNLGQKIVVTGTPGDTLVVVRLPFGSFSPTQPPAAVDFTVNMSNLADVNAPLSVQARGGFEFGSITPLNDWCCGDDAAGTLTSWSSGTVTPSLFTLSKSFSGPESETATGPNFPRTYTVTATIAAGQTINNLQLTDTLPNNVQFVSMVSPAAASCPTLPSTTTPGGTLRCNFAAASGTVNMTFNFYVPRVDSTLAAVLNASTGDDGTSCNNASITAGTWAALDTRDVGGLNFTTTPYSPAGCENTFTPKSIAIQKAVTVIGGGNTVPGKVLEYTLNVQVSDFFAFNNVIATDVISDGQHFDATFTPTIQVNGNGYAIATRTIAAANYTVDVSKIDVSDGPPTPPLTENPATDGTTTLTFRVSNEISRTRPNGRMIGGCVDPVNGSPTPDCSVYDNAGTTATIVFRTIVQEGFTDNYPTGDWSVDQGDVLDDVVNVTGDVLNTATPFTPTGNTEPDGSNASVSISRGALTKSIYAINGSTTLPTNALGQIIIKPSDTVTYRLTYVSATSDVENLYFEDFLPLPIFHSDDPDDNGTAGPAWTFDPTVSAASPASGVVKLGPSDTFYAYTAGAGTTGVLSPNTLHGAPATREPKISIDAGNNKLIVAYATYDDTRDISRTIDLLFTVTVSDEPFADNLYLTNQAMVYEGSTFNSPSSATSIVQVVLTEPVLVHKKGVIATNSTNPNISYSPATVGPVAFNAPGTAGDRWSGTIDSPGLALHPIDSNITGVDAGDLVSFAIVIENTGSSAKGAFDLTILDTLPAMYQIPAGGLNLRISNGDRSASFSYTRPDGSVAVPADLFSTGIEIVDPDPNNGACQAHTVGAGKNVIIITYDLEVRPDVTPGTQFNTATLVNYAGSDGGPNHVPSTPPTDTASSTVLASLTKQLVSTEINNANNSNAQAVIGELVTYRLTTTVPEGRVPTATVTDHLDGGLAFVSCTNVTPSSTDVTTDLASGSNFSGACADIAVSNNGQDVTFNLGNITNANRINTTADTITIEYVAVVLNQSSNQGGTLLNNEAKFFTGATQLGATQNASTVSIIEPNVNITKTVAPTTGDAGDSFTYTITLSGATSTDAFDVTLNDDIDSLMENLVLSGVTDTASQVTAANFNFVPATGILTTVTPFDIPVSASRQIVLTFTGTVSYSATPGQVIPNNANVQWTSMDGVVSNRSSYYTNPVDGNDDERTGSGSPAVNDYTKIGTAPFTVNQSASGKSFIITSEAHTPETGDGSNTSTQARPVTIGEIVRYRLISPVPEGTSPNFQVTDFLPTGLTFLDDGTARMALVYTDDNNILFGGVRSSSIDSVPAIPGGNACKIADLASLPVLPAVLPCALADDNVSSSSLTTSVADTYGTGDDIYFRLGSLNNNDNDADTEYAVIDFNVLVDNTVAGSNDAGDTRTNFSQTFIGGSASGAFSNNVSVKIVEPGLAPTKTANPASGDAGDVITYTLVFSNTGVNASTAYEVSLTDTVPGKMTANLGSMTVVPSGASCTGLPSPTNTSSGNNVNITYATVPVGCIVTATYTATLNTSVTAGEVLANGVTLTYSSLPGTGTTPNPTGSTTPGGSGATNGERSYNNTAVGNVNVTNFGPVKSILSTSAAHTTGAGNQSGTPGNVPDVAIGETLVYRLVTDMPEGTQTNLTVVDILPAGFSYVGNPVMSFIANTDVTENAALAGADNDALPPTFAVPAYAGAGTVGVEVSGQTVTFHLGDIINNDSDTGAPNGTEQVVIDFTVIVNNNANAGNTDGVNNNTDLRNNNYTVSTNNGSGVLTLRQTSNTVAARVVEPLLNIVKTANDSSWLYGQDVTFTHTITNPAPSLATAFEIVVTDTIPLSLTYVPGSITAPANWVANDTAAPTLTWTCATACTLPVNSTAALTYHATVDTVAIDPVNALTGSATAINNVTMTWTSLPGTNAGERTGTTPVVQPNDYTRTSSQTGSLAYYALGNRVWFDTNNNRAINFAPAGSSESEQPAGTRIGVNGVTMKLYKDNGSGTYVDTGLTQTTTNGGYYLFDNIEEGNYIVVIPATEFVIGRPLYGYWSSGISINTNGTLAAETAAPDPDTTATDSDDNGTRQTGGAYVGGVASLPVTLGPGAAEPAGETDLNALVNQGTLPDARANMTVDFGFYQVGVGDIVWMDDASVNGVYANGETLINGSTVSLYSADNTTQLAVSLSGVWTGATGAGSIVTGPSVDNPVWANGYYQFTGLPAGRYVVRVTGPTGTVSTIDTFDVTDSGSPSTNTNNNDNGIGVTSNVVTSATGAANAMNLVPAGAGHTITYTTGTSFNPTLDFGFANGYSIGNRVWFDTNNDSSIDFTPESEQPVGTKIGVNGVTVQLYAADGAGAPTGAVLRTTTTANGGYYLFDSVLPGNYVVVLPASNFTGAGALVGYWSSATQRNVDGSNSETTAALANADVDSDDNGTRQVAGTFINAVISSMVTVGGTEPINEQNTDVNLLAAGAEHQGTQPDNRSNMTVDFGFYRAEVGNLIFTDVNRNGLYDAGDTLLQNVPVELLSADGTSLGTTISNASGIYLFSGLSEGNYIIRVTAPNGTFSTIDTGDTVAPNDNTNPNDNFDNNDNGLDILGGDVDSALVNLNPGAAQNFNTITYTNGTTSNPTMDFGFTGITYSLGNRVWFDTNNSSTIDFPAESLNVATKIGVDGVTMKLYRDNGAGTYLDTGLTDLTANGGYYLFDGLSAGNYIVVIPSTEFALGKPLYGYWSSATTIDNAGVVSETAAPDPDLGTGGGVDSDDSGTLQTSGAYLGGVAALPVTLGPTEPTGEHLTAGGHTADVDATETGANNQGFQPDDRANMTVDFGFYRLGVGDIVWIDDVLANGNYAVGETLFNGASVSLYAGNGTTQLAVAADGVWQRTTGASSVSSGDAANGWANGYYAFTGLPAGNYVIKVVGPASSVSTTDSADTATPNNNVNNNDNGVGTAGNSVSSNQFALSPGTVGTAPNIITYTTGTSFNPSLDFGFLNTYSVGNRVWFDTNNSSDINFTAESEQPLGTKIGVDGVTVELYAAVGGLPTGPAIRTTTTAHGGYYLFDSVNAGDFVVVIPAANFDNTGVGDTTTALVGYWSSGTQRQNNGTITEAAAASADNTTDSDDNGTRQTAGVFNNAVISSMFTLGPIGNTEPTGEHLDSAGHTADVDVLAAGAEHQGTQPDARSNMMIDFGFYRVEIGNLVFADVNRNGLFDGGDTVLQNVPLELFSAGGTSLGTTNSDNNGLYKFSGQPSGSYYVRAVAPTGTVSTIDTGDTTPPNDNTSPDDNFDSNDNGVGILGGNTNSAVVALTPGAAQNFNSVTYTNGTTTNPTIDFGFANSFSLGNRVWFDTNNDGFVAVGTEVGVPNVRVELYRDSGASAGVFDSGDVFIAFDDTDALGYYRFDGLWPDNYIVVIPADNFRNIGAGDNVATDPLAGYLSSGTEISAAGVISDTFSPAPDSPASVDNDDNGASTFVSNLLSYVSAQAVTIGPGSTEPEFEAEPTPNPDTATGEAADNRSDRTVDFGFYRMQLSDQIFNDLNNDGMFTGADSPLAGAVVQLFASNGTTEIRVGPDGILGTADDAAGGVTTLASGTYLFGGLPKGDYIVKVTPPSGYSTTDVNADTTTPNNNVDNNDNGLLGNPGQVSSAVVTLTPGVAGASTTVTNATATTLNPSMDFGFIPLYSLGNRIWFDTDNNSTINGAEVGVNNVRVELYLDNGNGAYDAGDTFQSFTTTDASGFYRFDGLAPAGYVVLIPSSQFAAGGALDRYWSSGTTIAINGTVTDSTTIAPDAGDIDSDDNGITTLLGNTVNYVSSKLVTLGPGLSEPPTDNSPVTNPVAGEAPNDQSNRTVDFGFYRVELSNQIFWDVNSDGIFGTGDVVLPGATVKLYSADNSTEIPVGPDGILGTVDDAAGGIANDAADGTYLFGGLPAGSYVVRVTPPAGFDSTIDNGTVPAGADSATPNNNLDNNDNGVGIGTGEVSSNAVPLTPGVVSLNNVVTNSSGTTLNPSLDFGFVQNSVLEFSLGNRVWFDTNNDGKINGAEIGIANVRIDLYVDNGTTAGVYDAGDTFVDFKTTDLTGYYRFDNLAAGNYVAVILPNQFASGGPLDGYWSSGTSIANGGVVTDGIGPDVDTNPADNDDNGVTTFAANVVNYVSSRAVTLGPTANEPVGETDKLPNPDAGEEPDNQSNRTVDFGFYQIQLGDQVFVDADNDGLYNNSDVPLAGARVQLFAGNGTTEINVGPDGILGTTDDAANGMVTLADGLYLFSGLPAGNYIVKVTPPAGYLSTVDANADTATPNNNLNNNDNGVGVAAGQVSSNQVSLDAGVSGASTTVNNATAITRNPSMDFGFNVTNGFLKTVVGTSEPNTGGTDVAIGEIVTYQLTFDLTAGLALNNVVVTDNMDKGLAFVDCVSITIAGAPVACSPVVSPITDPGDVAGNPANPGRQVVFNIGNIPAPVANTTMVIQYRAIALDVIENQSGVKVNNNATVTWAGGSLTSSAPNVNVVEPDMTIDKSATPSSNVALGTPIQFTLTINHTTPQSTADAFDVVVTDILPSTLEYVPCSVTYSGWAPTSPAAPAYCPGTTNTLTFTWDTFPRGQVAVINFTARLIGTPATNVASIAWTSLDIDPGVGGLPQQLSIHNPESTERWYDPTDNVNVYAVSDSVTINEPVVSVDDSDSVSKKLPTLLPATGFAPGIVTMLPEQPVEKSYTATDVWLEIPSQGIKMPIVGVPLIDGDWDLSWLSQEAGWLNGTAFPGWDGNSALTGHVTLPNGKPGPFANLGHLNWGDKIIVHAYGEAYIYEVRENRIIKPYSTSVLKHEDDAWLTLITCKTYIESTNTYADRTAVRAILVAVQKDATTSNTNDKR